MDTVTTCQGIKFSACLQGAFDGVFYSAAAGHFHSYNPDTFYAVICNDMRQLFGIVTIVRLGASAGECCTDLFHFCLLHGSLIVFGCLSLLKADCINGAGGAGSAAVAFFLVYLNNFSYYQRSLLKAFSVFAVLCFARFTAKLVGTLGAFKKLRKVFNRCFRNVFKSFLCQESLMGSDYNVGH